MRDETVTRQELGQVPDTDVKEKYVPRYAGQETVVQTVRTLVHPTTTAYHGWYMYTDRHSCALMG